VPPERRHASSSARWNQSLQPGPVVLERDDSGRRELVERRDRDSRRRAAALAVSHSPSGHVTDSSRRARRREFLGEGVERLVIQGRGHSAGQLGDQSLTRGVRHGSRARHEPLGGYIASTSLRTTASRTVASKVAANPTAGVVSESAQGASREPITAQHRAETEAGLGVGARRTAGADGAAITAAASAWSRSIRTCGPRWRVSSIGGASWSPSLPSQRRVAPAVELSSDRRGIRALYCELVGRG
jgi:hypothetical protein